MNTFQNEVSIEAVSSLTVQKALDDPQWVVIDARSSAAYMGWRMDGETREGHIKGATDFSADWIRFCDRHQQGAAIWLQNKMVEKNITPQTNIIVYDHTGNDTQRVCSYLLANGIAQLYTFRLSDWEGEMEHYPGYHQLVPVQWVKTLLDGGHPEHFNGGEYKIFEVSWHEASEQFLNGHIPGTVHIDSEEFEVGPEWIHVPPEKLEQFACCNGITVDTTVILYGMNNMAPAAKLWSVLRFMGVKHVYCLNGTMENWLDAGYPVETGLRPKAGCTEFGGVIPHDPSYLVDIAEAKRILAGEAEGQVVDIRRWENYIGQETGYQYVPKAGRIPGTIWCFAKDGYCNPDHTMINRKDMVAHWKKCGIDPSKKMAFFCGSASWGAAVIELFGRVAGYENATIYEGGWCQWQLDPKNPYETGIPVGMQKT